MLSTSNLRFIVLIAPLLLLVTVPACKKADGKVSVHGRVSYRGQALERASLNFFPEHGRPESAAVEDGVYATKLSPGEYTVIILIGAVVPQGYKEGDPLPSPKIVLPDQYTNRTKSTLRATIKEGQSEPIDFELK